MGFAEQVEKGVAVTRKIDGRDVHFGALTMRDFGTIRSVMPEDERKGATFPEIWTWARSPMGIIWTITLAAQKHDPMFTEKQVDTLGPAVFLHRLAMEILDVTAGDAQSEGGAEGNVTSPTGQSPPPS